MSVPNRFERQSGLVPRDALERQAISIIGVGAIGRQVALQLASIGAMRLQLFDFDQVEATNVTTQGYRTDEIGMLKGDATAAEIKRIDPSIEVCIVNDRFRSKYDVGPIVLCCVDSISARTAIWRSVCERNDLWIDGRMLGETVRLLAASDRPSRNHYLTTLFAESEAQVGSCTSKSTIYTASIAAGLMVHQLTRHLRHLPLDCDAMFNLLASELTVSTTT